MNSFVEKIKELDKGQIVIFSVVALVVIFLLYSLIKPSEDHGSAAVELGIPENRNKVQDYNSKLDAYNRNNEEKTNSVSLEFDINDFKTSNALTDDEKREKLEKEVDSVLNQNKIIYSSDERRTTPPPSPTTRKTPAAPPIVQMPKRAPENINKSFNDFFDSDPELDKTTSKEENKTDPFIYAVIHGSHTISENQRVKLRLTKPAMISGKSYDINSYIYAFPRFQKNRVLLNITTINHIPVAISAYDTEDSGLGIYVEGAKVVGEITNEATKDAIDDIDLGGVPIGKTIKNVFQKKQEIPMVTLLNGTKLILKPN